MQGQHRQTRRARSPLHGAPRGIALLEFVLVFPFAVLLVLGLVQGGLLLVGKLMLQHVTFMAARQGAVAHADEEVVRAAVIRGLAAWHQDSTEPRDLTRLQTAWRRAETDAAAFLTVERLSPGPQAFQDFGLVDTDGRRRIPNDNLRWRHSGVREASGVNVQDANLLKIKVRYGQALKVPLMGGLVRAVMCGAPRGAVPAWQPATPQPRPPLPDTQSDCARYHAFGRVPIEAFAVVHMHSSAEEP